MDNRKSRVGFIVKKARFYQKISTLNIKILYDGVLRVRSYNTSAHTQKKSQNRLRRLLVLIQVMVIFPLKIGFWFLGVYLSLIQVGVNLDSDFLAFGGGYCCTCKAKSKRKKILAVVLRRYRTMSYEELR